MCSDWILETTTSGTTTASFDETTTYSTVPYNGCELPSTDPNDERWTNYNASLYFFGGLLDPNAYPRHAPIVADISNSTQTMISIDCDFLQNDHLLMIGYYNLTVEYNVTDPVALSIKQDDIQFPIPLVCNDYGKFNMALEGYESVIWEATACQEGSFLTVQNQLKQLGFFEISLYKH